MREKSQNMDRRGPACLPAVQVLGHPKISEVPMVIPGSLSAALVTFRDHMQLTQIDMQQMSAAI